MQKITPHLWFDQEAIEAADFYVSVFPNSQVKSKTSLRNTPSGSVDIVTFNLLGSEFQAISAGPYFKFNPAISFQVFCNVKDEVDRLWDKLSAEGMALMELGAYPFSERYGWLQDKYGLSWQIFYTGEADIEQKIAPMFLFVGDVCGRAEEAMNFWTSIFPGGQVQVFMRHEQGEEPDKEGTIKYGGFSLGGQEFRAMDSAYGHAFAFNEAISFIVPCETQEEIDYYWEKLSAVPEAEQCGWLKDRFGVSWQIVPTAMDEMMSKGSKEQIGRVTEAFLKMKKFDLAELHKAYEDS